MLQRLSIVAALLFVPLGLSQQHHPAKNGTGSVASDPAPIPANRAADSYAIYSLLLPGAAEDRIAPTKTREWVVAHTTINLTDMNPAVPPNGQLTPPPDNPKAFEEALGDFEARKYERFQISAKGFGRESHPRLIDQQKVDSIRQSGQGGIIFFSAVYFNHAETAALVYVNQWCANLCSAGQWVYLEKHGGHWVRRSGISRGGA